MEDKEVLKKKAGEVKPSATARALVETLSETAGYIRMLADILVKEKAGKKEIADDLVKMANNVDECSRIAAIANIQREELEKNLAEQKLLVAQLGASFKKMEIRSETLDEEKQ